MNKKEVVFMVCSFKIDGNCFILKYCAEQSGIPLGYKPACGKNDSYLSENCMVSDKIQKGELDTFFVSEAGIEFTKSHFPEIMETKNGRAKLNGMK
jgi:hypothetical protein